jgi:hypothetical protein
MWIKGGIYMKLVNTWMIRLRIKCAQMGELLRAEDGIGTVEMILILVVLIGLVLIFKDKLNSLVGDIFDTIKSKSGSV